MGLNRAHPATARRVFGVSALVVALGALSAMPAQARSATDPAPHAPTSSFISFDEFIAGVRGTSYQGAAAIGATGKVATTAAYNEMRSYVLDMYRGVEVAHSYLDNGSYFDCVTVDSQPTVRALGISEIATPPALARTSGPAGQGLRAARSPLSLGQVDAFGNAISCARGTIPMQRLAMERLTAFPTLREFLAKKPGEAQEEGTVNAAAAHRYAVGYQYTSNYGGNSWLNLWNPSGEFSLSQQWYVGGSGSGTQTVEGGWVHYPAKFGSNSVLFIFFTPNNYASGCYNLDCTGFVQTSSAYSLGGAWSAYSTPGGTQWGFGEQWQYYAGNWWLFIQGTAIGYYPGSIYGSGPLASGGSNLIEYGGETYTGGSSWPQMGSGYWANWGWTWAAFQNTVFYIAPSYSTYWASLSPIVTNPGCYTYEYHSSSEGSSWGTYFYFGGPGGAC